METPRSSHEIETTGTGWPGERQPRVIRDDSIPPDPSTCFSLVPITDGRFEQMGRHLDHTVELLRRTCHRWIQR